jgi:hypothetical protein
MSITNAIECVAQAAAIAQASEQKQAEAARKARYEARI